MIDFFIKYYDRLFFAFLEHIEIVAVTMIFSILLASILMILSVYFPVVSQISLNITAFLYSIPSLAFFVLVIPITWLGKLTAIIVLTLYNQNILLGNFLTGINGVDKSIIELASGCGVTKLQILKSIKLPLGKKLFCWY